jgi:SAM-dependent methyltransferase
MLEKYDDRIPGWDFHHLVHRACPFCGSKGADKFIRPDFLKVLHCEGCGTFFVSPVPDDAQLDAFYSGYYSEHRSAELRQYAEDQSMVKEMRALDPLSDTKVRTLASIQELRGKRILDVGFGMGLSLVLMQKLGAEVHGSDVDPDAVYFVRKNLGIPTVRQCSLDELDEQQVYDVVTLHDLVEHLFDPLKGLRKATSLLGPGGLLSVWTPNASRALNDPQPMLFRVDLEHMQYLSFDSCRFIAGLLGLEIVHLESTGFPRLGRIRQLSGRGSTWSSVKRFARRAGRSVPGFTFLNTVRHRLTSRNERRGAYHLFCIFRKPFAC